MAEPDQAGHPDPIGGPVQSGHIGQIGHPYEIWDVFTDTPLEGNPLGVFPHAEEIPSRLYQKVARELNLSETVFIAGTQIRIFTPATELPFAGHPTLGAAFVVAGRDHAAAVTLQTGAGPVTVRIDHVAARGEMDQPYPTVAPYPHADRLAEILGAEPTTPVEIYTNGPSHVVFTLAAGLAELAPDMAALAALGEHGNAIVTPLDRTSALTRNFCPGLGVPEDPATGSAAGPIALHLVRHGLAAPGQTLQLTQGVEIGRPSTLYATASEDGPVRVAGGAVRVAAGHYRLG